MAAKRKKLPKELRKPKLASVVLEVSSKSGAPMSAKEKFRLRQAMRQFARAAIAIKDMPKWVLICKKCQVEFQHSQISDVGMASFYLPLKPELSPEGQKCYAQIVGTSAYTTALICSIGLDSYFSREVEGFCLRTCPL